VTGGLWSVEAVAFDLDGTLVDTEPIFSEAVRRLLARRGIDFDAAFMASIMGTPAAEALPRFCARFRLADPAALAEECRELFADLLGARPAPLMPGAAELLARLRSARRPAAIATSSGPEFVERVFGPHGLMERFDFVLTCADVVRGKPAPEVYEKAAARFGVEPSRMLVLEDSPNGLRAAKAAGARCVVVPHAQTPSNELAEADAVVPSLASAELRQILGF